MFAGERSARRTERDQEQRKCVFVHSRGGGVSNYGVMPVCAVSFGRSVLNVVRKALSASSVSYLETLQETATIQ